jgi:putative transposase
MGENRLAAPKKKAFDLNASLVFIDESGLMMAPVVRRTWAPQGKTPILKQAGRSHKKVSVIAALIVPPHRRRVGLHFAMHTDANITATRVVRFLRHLRRHLRKSILLVWDRSNTHRAKIVNRFFEDTDRWMPEFFPPYAPELNPVEAVWGWLKTNPLANWAPPDVKTLGTTARYHTQRLRNRPDLVRSFLKSTPLF